MIPEAELKQRPEAVHDEPPVWEWERVGLSGGTHAAPAGWVAAPKPHFQPHPVADPPADAVFDLQRPLREFIQRLSGYLTADADSAVTVEGQSIRFNPDKMSLGRFYLAQIEDEAFLICRVGEDVIDVYGLAKPD